MRTLLLALLFAPFASAAPVPKELKTDERGRFVGEWWESRMGDSTYSDAALARRFTFDRDGTLGIRQRAGAAPTDYQIAIDTAAPNPCFTFAQNGQVIFHAAYRIDGDTFSFALTSPGQPLAAEIKPGGGALYYELKKVK